MTHRSDGALGRAHISLSRFRIKLTQAEATAADVTMALNQNQDM